MFGAISEKFRTFDMRINFAIPPIFHFRRWLGEFFFPFSKSRNFHHFINQLVKKVENFLGISRQSLFIQKYYFASDHLRRRGLFAQISLIIL